MFSKEIFSLLSKKENDAKISENFKRNSKIFKH